jgi:16S rRNA (cytidine1402-2'-O)-methyltransferase
MNSSHEFYIVSTPIGNLADMSFRAVEVLKNVDVVLCEDTRVTKKLCDYYDIDTTRESYHAHSTNAKEEGIIQRCKDGTTFALVSDAGTPTISDPGVKLISALKEKLPDLDIIAIPGATAVITALSVSGFTGNDFRFFGFAPHKRGRQRFFNIVAEHPSIAVFYESSHRITKTLEALVEHHQLSGRKLCVARELTKMFEEKQYGTAQEILDYYRDYPEKVKGEFVVVVDKV